MPSTLICCSSIQQHLICWLSSCVIVPFVPPLMIWYMEIQLLIWSDIEFQHHWLAFYMWYLDIDSDLYFWAMLRWFIVYFQFSYTCIHVGSIQYFRYDVFLTEHGYAHLSMSWLSGFFHWFWQAEIWWSPLLSLRSSFYVHNTFRPSCTPSDLIY